MSIPETTSAEGFETYVDGKCLFHSRGEAWRDIKAWIVALPPIVDTLQLPSVSEPFLAWTMSGEVDFQEREYKRPWIMNRIKEGTFFLTAGGAPYECRWKAVTSEPFAARLVLSSCRFFKGLWKRSSAPMRLRPNDVNLDRLAAQARLSKFHFHRLFKSATGVSPAHYHINLRMNVARRLLRETKQSVVDGALDLATQTPAISQSSSAEKPAIPSDYRRQR